MSKSFDCRLNIPYPEVSVEGRNTYYAGILLNDLSGQVSEMSAVTQYVYQHIVTQSEKISEAMKCISMVEMHHYGIISKLIYELGCNPKLAVNNSRGSCFWSGQYIDYSLYPRYFLKLNIGVEQKAIDNYRRHIDLINDKYIRAVLERIILDEKHHIEIFNELLAEIGE